MHMCVYLSTVEVYLKGIYIYLALVSAAILRVGQRCGLSSHMFYIYALVRLESSHWVVYFYKVYSNPLDI